MRNNRQEELIREAVREILVQEGFLGDIWTGIKSGVSSIFGFDDESEKSSASDASKKSEILGYGPGGSCDSDVLDSFRCRLGKEKGRGINFHKLEDGKNNYRAGLDDEDTVTSPEFFKELKKDYGIEHVITLNKDSGGKGVPDKVRAAGLESHVQFMGHDNLPSRAEFDEIKRLLNQGNTLIHCTHGADRTGTTVGRYMIEDHGWDVNRAVEYTRSFGGHKKGHAYSRLRNFLENGPEGSPSAEAKAAADSEDLGFFGTIGAALSSLFGDDEPDAPDPRVDGPRKPLPDATIGNMRINRIDNFYTYDEFFKKESQRTGVPFAFIKAIGIKETGLKPDLTSPAGAEGLMQFMPKAQRDFNLTNPWDPAESIRAGADYLKRNLGKYNGSFTLASAAYNAGPGNVKKYGGVPPFKETQNYVERVEDLYNFLKDHHPEYSAPSWS